MSRSPDNVERYGIPVLRTPTGPLDVQVEESFLEADLGRPWAALHLLEVHLKGKIGEHYISWISNQHTHQKKCPKHCQTFTGLMNAATTGVLKLS